MTLSLLKVAQTSSDSIWTHDHGYQRCPHPRDDRHGWLPRVEEPEGPQVRTTARLAAIAVLAVATLAGCVRVTSDTTVHADDTFSQVAILAVTDDARSQLASLAQVNFDDLKGTITGSEGYLALEKKYPGQLEVADYTDGDLKGVQITATDLPLKAFETSFSTFTSQLPLTGNATLVRTDDTYVVSIPTGAIAEALSGQGISAGQLDLLGSSIDVSLSFTFPGLVTSATVGDIKGNTVTVDLADLASGTDITIVASAANQFYWKPWLMWGGIALAILVIVGGATALIVQDVRRHRSTPLPSPDPVAGQAPHGPGILPAGETIEA